VDITRAKPEEEMTLLRARVEELEQLVERSIVTNTLWSGSSASSSTPEINGPAQSILLSSLFFLDHRSFIHLHYSGQPVSVPVTNDLINILRGEYDQPQGMQQLMSRYFDAVHRWMPILSKTRMRRLLDPLVGDVKADTAFLLSCVKLLLKIPKSGSLPEDLPIYRMVKAVSLQLEMAGIQSLDVVQGGIMIGVFELGHSIYPAAYTTVAQCARKAISIGLHNREEPQFLQPWADWEEEIRVWWFILMLDRYAKLF
jgi:hypothetical protein